MLMLFNKHVGKKQQSDNINSTYVKFELSYIHYVEYKLPAQLLARHLHPFAGKHQEMNRTLEKICVLMVMVMDHPRSSMKIQQFQCQIKRTKR